MKIVKKYEAMIEGPKMMNRFVTVEATSYSEAHKKVESLLEDGEFVRGVNEA